ncbi:hypothetical protein [Anaerovibrio sp.]|uniref:hypothetical protein n=1 Tax=Anaerovibrio sp. TaxID=1872532 RepID=UPI003F1411BE
MFAFLKKVWSGLTGAGEKKNSSRKSAASPVEGGKNKKPDASGMSGVSLNVRAGRPDTPAGKAAGKEASVSKGRAMTERAGRRSYAGRLPICEGCLNIGGCAGFFPGCGCYGHSHDTVKVSSGGWHGLNAGRGSNLASPEFAAWCAFMGYPVAERYWAEYEDIWNYYEEALHEYGSEYEAFDAFAADRHNERDCDEYDYDEYTSDDYACDESEYGDYACDGEDCGMYDADDCGADDYGDMDDSMDYDADDYSDSCQYSYDDDDDY